MGSCAEWLRNSYLADEGTLVKAMGKGKQNRKRKAANGQTAPPPVSIPAVYLAWKDAPADMRLFTKCEDGCQVFKGLPPRKSYELFETAAQGGTKKGTKLASAAQGSQQSNSGSQNSNSGRQQSNSGGSSENLEQTVEILEATV